MYAGAVLSVFCQRYAEARNQFIAAAETSSVLDHVDNLPHTLKGPKNERLFCDVAWLGNPKASNVLVMVSGLHGVEGSVGSAIQTDFINRHRRLPDDVAVVIVHALNPWGFAWSTRHDHEGIDLNRNFIDFTAELPDSEPALKVWKQLKNKKQIDVVGQDRAQFDCLSQGQYADSGALYYGGTDKSWSRQTLEGVIEDLKPDKRREVMVIDIHSGLGPYGYGELICDHPHEAKACKRAIELFGTTVTEPALGTSSSGFKYGLHDYFWHQQGPQVCFLTLEFGTFGNAQMLDVLLADHRLHQSGKADWTRQQTLDVKHAIQDFFSPQETQWQELVLFRGRQVMEMALAGLSGQTYGH